MNPSYDNSFGSLQPGGTNPMGAGGVPMGFQNNSGAPMSQPIGSGTGDIVLGGGEPVKKSRNGLVVGIVVAVLAVLILVGVLIWSGMRSSTENYQPTDEFATELRRIINYMYLGEESDVGLAEIPEDARFVFEDIFYSDRIVERVSYFETARGLQSDAMDIMLSNEQDAASEYNTLLTSINGSLYRASSVAVIEKPSLEDFENAFVNNISTADFKKIIDEKYEKLLNSNNDSLEFYGQAYIDFFNMRVDEIALIGRNNCLDYVSSLEEFEGLENCPSLENFIGDLSNLEDNNGELGYSSSQEKEIADGIINSDIVNLAKYYRQLNMELNQ